MGTGSGKNSPDYGSGVAEIDLGALQTKEQTAKALSRQIALLVKSEIESKSYKPPLLPEVAISLTELSRKQNVSIKEVEGVVQRDPAVTAKVVSVANSAFYSRGTSVRTLRAAITRLGLVEVRDVAFQVVAQTRIFKVPGYSDRMRELFTAGRAAGLFAKEVCRVLRFESELAYLCGLLHDMGEAIILGVVGQQAQQAKSACPPLEHVAPAVATYHARVGARICTLWSLPPSIIDAIYHHHKPAGSKHPSQMATVTAIADLLLGHIGFGTPQRPINPMEEPLFYQLNMHPRQVSDLIEFAENVGEDPEAWLG